MPIRMSYLLKNKDPKDKLIQAAEQYDDESDEQE